MQKRVLFLFIFSLMSSLGAKADPFGTVDTIYEGPPKLEATFRSDLWTSPYQNKASPLRIYTLEIIRPVINTDQWKLTLKLKTDGLRIGNAGVAVGNDDINIGGDLRSQWVGLSLAKKYSEGSSSAFFGSYNSESDEPFRESRDTALDFGFYHKFVPDENHQWLVGFDKSKNRGIFNDKFLPLFGVIYKPNPDFVAVMGFPFLRLAWLDGPWQRTFNLTPIGMDAQLSHNINDYLTFYARTGVSNRSYMHTARTLNEMRVIYEEKYIELSSLRMVSAQASIETSLGYSFNRRLYEAKRVFSPFGDVTDIQADVYGNLKMRFLF